MQLFLNAENVILLTFNVSIVFPENGFGLILHVTDLILQTLIVHHQMVALLHGGPDILATSTGVNIMMMVMKLVMVVVMMMIMLLTFTVQTKSMRVFHSDFPFQSFVFS